ncbi:serine/threonine-protein kinase [Nocardia sp. NBC_01327]|uniref:serine/threonine-protein kinase n=1 Tax=Nocardia sp. NBC_01327 TaxID=2903593 RepID=UPI002E14EF43|nr:protein kinase [Nocardia sp. NBC_01327]
MLNSGDVFAGFTIERLLGQGGMGSVYLARHPRLGRLTALKLLNRELFADREIRIRFNREADLVAQLDHPNIVEVYDRGTEDEQLWISMQYIDGVDAAGVDVTMLPPERAVQIIEGVAAALDYAHTMGVLHRDVKPANIILARAVGGHGERVFLTDFGIARLREDSTHLTQRGMFTATLAYASPEQMTGAHLDHTTDQYSLACALYWLLIGAGPFDSPDPSELIRGHLQLLPPPVSLRRPGLTPAMDAVITKGMAKRPMDRFPSCSEFAKAARRALTASPGQPVYPNQPAPQLSSPPGYAPAPAAYAPPAGYPAPPQNYPPGAPAQNYPPAPAAPPGAPAQNYPPVPAAPQGYPAAYPMPSQGYPAGYPAAQQPALAPQQPIPAALPHPQTPSAHTSNPNASVPQQVAPPPSSDPANPEVPPTDSSGQLTDVVPHPVASPTPQEALYSQPTDSFPTPRVPPHSEPSPSLPGAIERSVSGTAERQPGSAVAQPEDLAAGSKPETQVAGADTRLSCDTGAESPPAVPPQSIPPGTAPVAAEPPTSLGPRPADPGAHPKHAARTSGGAPSNAADSEPQSDIPPRGEGDWQPATSTDSAPDPAEGVSESAQGSAKTAVGEPNTDGSTAASGSAPDAEGTRGRTTGADVEVTGGVPGAVDQDSMLTADSPIVAAGAEPSVESAEVRGAEVYPGPGLRHPQSGEFVPAEGGGSGAGGSAVERRWARGAAPAGSAATGAEATGAGMHFGGVDSTGSGAQFPGVESTGSGAQFSGVESTGPGAPFSGVESTGPGPQFPGVDGTGRGFGPPPGYPMNSGPQQSVPEGDGVGRSQVAALVVLGVAAVALLVMLAIVVVQVVG